MRIRFVDALKSYIRKFVSPPELIFDVLFSNVVEGSLVVNLDNIKGSFEIDARSDLLKRILATKEYEHSLVQLISDKTDKGKDAINVGANIGLYAVLLAQLLEEKNRVLAIEPTINAFKLLSNNIERNGVMNKVQLFNGLAADVSGNYTINTIEGKEEYSSIGSMSHPAIENVVFSSVNVLGSTIDQLVDEFNLEPGLLLIDVEGAEHKVLNGALNTIRRFSPLIIAEVDDSLLSGLGTSSANLFSFLENEGYSVHNVLSNDLSMPFCGNIYAVKKYIS
jgi:FkbM family methyltransferase